MPSTKGTSVTRDRVRHGVIAVVDYGIGNLRSAEKALQHLGADARLTRDAREIGSAPTRSCCPASGAFGACMQALRDAGLEAVAKEAATDGRPFLGICVGMQMLFDGSDESPDVAGLGVVAGSRDPTADDGAASADRVEHARDPAGSRLAAGLARSARGCTSCTRTRPIPTTTRSSPRGATTAAGSRPRSKSGRCGRRSSTPRSRAPSGCGCMQNFVDGREPHCRCMDLYPVDRPARRAVVRLQRGDYDAQTIYDDDPVAVARDFDAAGARVDPRRRSRRGALGRGDEPVP